MLELDAKDRKLLYAIDLNARIGTTLLGKNINLSQEGTFYRLKNLENKSIISGYISLINFSKIGYTGYAVYARFQNVTPEQKNTIIQELKQEKHIYWIAEFGGKFDMAFAIMAKNIIHFNEIFTGISAKYNNTLKDHTISIRVELTQFPRKYLIDNIGIKKQPYFGRNIELEKLDKIDHDILKTIAENARMPALEIAKNINKPFSTVNSRLKQLEKHEIIQGYSAKIHCQEFGYQSYQLFLNTHDLTLDKKRKLYSYCSLHKNIIFYIETVGKWNFEVIYEIENQKEMQNSIIELRTNFSDIITDVESIIIFNHYIKYNHFPL